MCRKAFFIKGFVKIDLLADFLRVGYSLDILILGSFDGNELLFKNIFF
jgi:hypothetical protein